MIHSPSNYIGQAEQHYEPLTPRMTEMGAIYGQSAEIGGILYRINSDGAYGHILIGNT